MNENHLMIAIILSVLMMSLQEASAQQGCTAGIPYPTKDGGPHFTKDRMQTIWCGTCRSQIGRNWHDDDSTIGKKLSCTLTVDKSGKVKDLKIETSSGSTIADKYVLENIEKAAPFFRYADSMIGNIAKITFDDNDAPKFTVSILSAEKAF